MDLLNRLKRHEAAGLQENPVAVPELASIFEPGEPTLLYMATLAALEKDRMDDCYRVFLVRQDLTDRDSRDLYRSFVVAYCLCDEKNVRAATDNTQLDQLVSMIAGMENRIVGRLFAVCNGANRIYGIDDDLKKGTEVEKPKTVNDAGNGESPSTSVTRRAVRGSSASVPPSTQSSGT